MTLSKRLVTPARAGLESALPSLRPVDPPPRATSPGPATLAVTHPRPLFSAQMPSCLGCWITLDVPIPHFLSHLQDPPAPSSIRDGRHFVFFLFVSWVPAQASSWNSNMINSTFLRVCLGCSPGSPGASPALLPGPPTGLSWLWYWLLPGILPAFEIRAHGWL